MAKIEWDAIGERFYETGVDHGVLYRQSGDNNYGTGVPWNGLTSVNEEPSGAEPSPLYADNIKYLNLMSTEEFGGTIEAYTYPDEFAECDGTAQPVPGITVGQQPRKQFGFSYRTLVGNDTQGQDLGHKLHLVYNALAAPSAKNYQTVNDSPEAIAFSWTFSTTPVTIEGMKPTATLTFDSREIGAENMAQLEAILYGDDTTEPRLPFPNELIAMFGGSTDTEGE